MFQRGGQRRTIETGCGWRCVGHPQEVNGKFKLHKKYCNTCNETFTEELPSFNKKASKINGWKGLTDRGQKPNQMLTTAFVDGVRQDIYLKDVKNLEDAMDDAKLTASLLAEQISSGEIPVPLSKSQKKRQKQKAKKEKHQEIIEGAMNMYIPSGDIDAFLETIDDKTEEELTYELAELLGGKMTEEELGRLIKALEK